MHNGIKDTRHLLAHKQDIVEIKCPIKCKKTLIYNEENGKFQVGYLEMQQEVTLEKKSPILHSNTNSNVLGTTICDLFVYSPLGRVTVEVHRDETIFI